MELGLRDKIVLVTGASKGIGKAIAEAFAAEGSKVAIAARGAEELRRTASEISKGSGTEAGGATSLRRLAAGDRELLLSRGFGLP